MIRKKIYMFLRGIYGDNISYNYEVIQILASELVGEESGQIDCMLIQLQEVI